MAPTVKKTPDQPPVDDPASPPPAEVDQPPAGPADGEQLVDQPPVDGQAEPGPTVSLATTAAMRGEAPPSPAAAVRPFLSEGIRAELVAAGRAGDPVLGGTWHMDKETGEITYTDRAGIPVELS